VLQEVSLNPARIVLFERLKLVDTWGPTRESEACGGYETMLLLLL